jgi:hypothetical protein
MSYIVNWRSTGTGQALAKPSITIAEKTSDSTSTSLVLTGKGLNNYGLFQQQNFVWLLENFASELPPDNPTVGQMWYDTRLGVNKFWNGSAWSNKLINNFAGPNPPLDPEIGQFWYDTNEKVLKVYNGEGDGTNPDDWDVAFGGGASGIIVVDINNYSPDPDTSTVGFASRLNRLIGSPIGTNETNAYGWGQNDFVPTYNSSAALSAQATQWQNNGLPNGLNFPATFNNEAWTIALSRLRKACRMVGLDESTVSSVGFIDDAKPKGAGNELANYYNNFNAGPAPYQGTKPNYTAGFNGLSSSSVDALYQATEAVLTKVEQFRFSLGPTQTQILSGPAYTKSRNSATQTLTVPSGAGAYVLTKTFKFPSEQAADAYFNAGGQIQFNPSFTPTGTPSTLESDWLNFLNYFTGFSFDYAGVKKTSQYASESFTPVYLASLDDGSDFSGYYDLTSTAKLVFNRDVLDLPGAGLYNNNPPTNGGIILKGRKLAVGSEYHVIFDLEFYLRHSANDNSDTSLTGVLSSNVALIFANSDNLNFNPILPPTLDFSGTFVTAP